jgi:glycerophosphoryl diester phosphodiesterase
VLAHRGGRGQWRENTLEAFEGALRAGADGVELDVRRCGDGALVVHHDPEVPGCGPVHACARAELPAWIPDLDEALATCAGAAGNVEIKNTPGEAGYDPDQSVARRLASELTPERPAGAPAGGPAHLVVSSFWPESLAALRAGGEGIPRALLVHPGRDADEAVASAAALGCVSLNLHHSHVEGALVERAHHLGMAVMTWTVNGRQDLDAVVRAGVDAVITDQVEAALAVLGRA